MTEASEFVSLWLVFALDLVSARYHVILVTWLLVCSVGRRDFQAGNFWKMLPVMSEQRKLPFFLPKLGSLERLAFKTDPLLSLSVIPYKFPDHICHIMLEFLISIETSSQGFPMAGV